MKYIKLFEQEYSVFDLIAMSPEDAGKVLSEECEKKNPNIELIQNILEFAPVNVNLKDEYGRTALMWASILGHTEIVRMLLQRPEIDVNLQTEYGSTALMIASANGHTEIVRMLLEKPEILVNLQNSGGMTALMYASKWGHTEIVNLIRSHSNFNPTA